MLVVAPQPFYRDRGTPIAVRQVLEALSELGYAVDLLTFPMGEAIALPGLEIHRVSGPFPIREVPIGFSAGKLLLDLSLSVAVRHWLGRRQYNALHAVEEAAFPCSILARRHGIPLIYDMQSSLPEQLETHRVFGGERVQRRLRTAEAWILRRAEAVACSAGLKSHVLSNAPRANVHEWWFAAPPLEATADEVAGLRRELQLPPHARVVLYTGNFAPYQGVPLLLEAADRVHAEAPEAVFVLVGGSREEAGVPEPLLAALERDSVVRLVGRQPRRRMPLFVAAADVLVSPRRHGENLPLKIFDYLRAGKPIVATDTPTHRTVLDDSRAVLARLSAPELAASITMILRDSELSERIGRAAGEWANENLGWEMFRERVAKLYRSVESST